MGEKEGCSDGWEVGAIERVGNEASKDQLVVLHMVFPELRTSGSKLHHWWHCMYALHGGTACCAARTSP